jgi:L-iditol 2-dehydrogenase
MKAAVLESVGWLRVKEVESPRPVGPAELLVQVQAVGICGSEIHAFKGTHPFRKPPSVLGHEVGGRVVEVGAQVRAFAPGDRVFVDPQWTCGQCRWCTTGRHNLCPSKVVLGTREWSGGLGEYILASQRSVYPLPEHVSYVEGTLIEPLSVAVHVVDRVGVEVGESVAVLGTGPIGMMVAAVASVRGASPIVAVDRQRHCLDVVQDHFGATHGLLADEGPISDRILEIVRGKGIDVIFLTVGVPALVDEALTVAAREARIMFVALFDQPVRLEPNQVIDKHLSVLGTSMYNAADIETAIDLISSGRVQAKAMVSHVLPVEEAARGFDLAATKRDGAIKVVLEFGRS